MALTKIKCTDGFELGAYEAIPSGDAKGAVVVIQEVFGVNSHIRSVVDDYAAEGFYAIEFVNDSIAFASGRNKISKLIFKE